MKPNYVSPLFFYISCIFDRVWLEEKLLDMTHKTYKFVIITILWRCFFGNCYKSWFSQSVGNLPESYIRLNKYVRRFRSNILRTSACTLSRPRFFWFFIAFRAFQRWTSDSRIFGPDYFCQIVRVLFGFQTVLVHSFFMCCIDLPGLRSISHCASNYGFIENVIIFKYFTFKSEKYSSWIPMTRSYNVH